MKRLFVLICLTLLPMVFAGCAINRHSTPGDAVVEKIRVLGVVPVIVDASSDIRFPQKDQLVNLIYSLNRSSEHALFRKIRETGAFRTVTLLDAAPPEVTFNNLLLKRERRDDAGIQYNKYFWKNDKLVDFAAKNGVDAVMFVVVSGITRPDKLYSSNLLDNLETEFNCLIMTAQIIDRDGDLIWEYPHFRQPQPSYKPLINLQYPDFDEAKANMSHKVFLKFKHFEGVRRALEKRRTDMLMRDTKELDLYSDQFDEIISLIEFDKDRMKSLRPGSHHNAPSEGVMLK